MSEKGRPCANAPECTELIPPQKGSARPRKYCAVCRPPRNRGNPRVIRMPGGPAESVQPDGSPVVAGQGVVGSYRARLETAGVLESPEGAHVMLLASLLEEGMGSHTAAGAASLSKELRAAMEAALKDAPAEPDMLDELAERRRQKASGA